MAIVFSGNQKYHQISSSTPLDITVKHNDIIIYSQKLSPVNNIIKVDIGNIANNVIKYELSDTNAAFTIDSISVTANDTTTSYNVIKGGVDAILNDTNSFLNGNFLTWQPQVLNTHISTPQRLRYVATAACQIKAKLYGKDTSTTVKLADITAGNGYDIDTSFTKLNSLASFTVTAADVWAANGNTVLSFIQRYIYNNNIDENRDVFVFLNSLGGYDCLELFGYKIKKIEAQSVTATNDNSTLEIDNDTVYSYKKFSGLLSPEEVVSLEEFLSSSEKYVISKGALIPIYIEDKSSAEIENKTLSTSVFTYRLSKKSIYKNIARQQSLPNTIEFQLDGAVDG